MMLVVMLAGAALFRCSGAAVGDAGGDVAWAAGGVVSTTQDLALWAKELYSGSFLSKAWTDSMTTQTEIKGRETGYGLGMVYRK